MNNIVFVLLRRLHSPLIALVAVYSISILGFTLIPGVDNNGQPWRMDFFHAFYFVSFMGTTIGFGELPYAFTDAQRMWATVSIYATVITWLYGIGFLLSILQDPAFRNLMTATSFRRSIRRISEPFYLICGYGDTGTMLVKAFTEANVSAVVVEIEADRVHALEVEDHRIYVPGLCGDASDANTLLMAGLRHKHCTGVVALTNNDAVNLKVAITAKLLNPRLRIIARAETKDAEANISSFGTEHVINPFDTFAGRLAMALHSPGTYLLYEWLTGVPHEKLTEPLFPPHGKWVLCGYGRFGKALHQRLLAEGLEVAIIEANPEITQAPQDVVIGRGTEAKTLQQARITHAVGIVAGTDDDANNLSILITAGELNPDLFMVARQNSRSNDAIFKAASVDLIMQRGNIIAHKIFALIRTPLLGIFLDQASKHSNEWANEVVSRIGGVTSDQSPVTWEVDITKKDAGAILDALEAGTTINIGHLCQDPRDRDEKLPCIPLLLRNKTGDYALLPDEEFLLAPGDQILFSGTAHGQTMLAWLLRDPRILEYILTGEEHPSGYLWRLLTHQGRNTTESTSG